MDTRIVHHQPVALVFTQGRQTGLRCRTPDAHGHRPRFRQGGLRGRIPSQIGHRRDQHGSTSAVTIIIELRDKGCALELQRTGARIHGVRPRQQIQHRAVRLTPPVAQFTLNRLAICRED
jgi:hypothetical protein